MPYSDYYYWGNCSAYLEDKLTKFQKRAARLILDRYFSTPSAFLFSELEWMPFPDRVIYQKSSSHVKTIHVGTPEYLRTLLHLKFIQEYLGLHVLYN